MLTRDGPLGGSPAPRRVGARRHGARGADDGLRADGYRLPASGSVARAARQVLRALGLAAPARAGARSIGTEGATRGESKTRGRTARPPTARATRPRGIHHPPVSSDRPPTNPPSCRGLRGSTTRRRARRPPPRLAYVAERQGWARCPRGPSFRAQGSPASGAAPGPRRRGPMAGGARTAMKPPPAFTLAGLLWVG